jgi:lycopene beta-cyclase
MNGRDIDIAILGGGLAGGLIALALARLRPELRLLLIEQGERFGGNHVWSFFASDVAHDDGWLVDPLVVARWDSYEVRFQRYVRAMTTPYRSITSERLDQVLNQTLPAEARLTGARVTAATPISVSLADGRVMAAGAVIDARGVAGLPGMAGGWQKFMGRMVRLKQPHEMLRPVVMDVRLEQRDGFRFIYCLPFSSHEVFVEDTYYSSSPVLDQDLLGERLDNYCRFARLDVAEVLREETGVLPVIAEGDFGAFWPQGAPARAGARAALLHPLTSYSLPDAVRFACCIGAQKDMSGAALARVSRAYALRHWQRGRFYRSLATMMFGAARPSRRYKVLEHFYQKPQGLIERFYAGRSSWLDKLRLMTGAPPVPVGRAISALRGKGSYPLSPLDNAQ